MASKILTATFPSTAAAAAAAQRIGKYGVSGAALRLEASTLRASVDDAYAELVTEALRDAGMLDLDVSQNTPESEDWMNHHSGRTTSAGVPPGQGDAEAGTD